MSTQMRGPLKVRRTGRHTAPSQVGKVAGQAGKAAPAVAIAGALVAAASQPQAAVANPASPAERMHTAATVSRAARVHTAAKVTRTAPVHTAAKVTRAARAVRTYTVRPGDTLFGIAQRLYGHYGYLTWLYVANRTQISNPNLIYPGQVLVVPSGPPQHAAAIYARAAHLAASQASGTGSGGSQDGSSQDGSSQAGSTSSSSSGASSSGSTTLSGTLGCSGLEQLWQEAGGSPGQAVVAASIAMAESSGEQYASSPAGDVGYWQINEPIWGPSLATSDPLGNAKAAIEISHDGTDWTPWVTYDSGAYQGQCSGSPAQATTSAYITTQPGAAADSSGGHEDSASVTFDYSAHRWSSRSSVSVPL
jgi:LysM repeat protein